MTATTNATITFEDGFKVTIGQRVKVRSTRGTEGAGTVVGFNRNKVCVNMDAGTVFGQYDHYPLKDGGFYNAILTAGVGGGCLCRDAKFVEMKLKSGEWMPLPMAYDTEAEAREFCDDLNSLKGFTKYRIIRN